MARIILMAALVVLVAGCTPSSPAASSPNLTPPIEWSVDLLPYPLNLTYESEVRNIQQTGSISLLQQALEKYEADTFAGLWLRHDPEGVVVAFTQNGEATIRRYVGDSSLVEQVEVRHVEASLVELQSAREETQAFMDAFDFPFESGIFIKENQVEFYITDRAALDAALDEAQMEISDHVALITVYEPLGEDPPFPLTPNPSIFLPQRKYASYSHMLALLIGELILDNNCLRVWGEGGGPGVLIIWEPDYFINNNQGVIEVLDREGEVVARVGEEVSMGGGFVDISEEWMPYLKEPIPDECPPPHFIMGSIVKDE